MNKMMTTKRFGNISIVFVLSLIVVLGFISIAEPQEEVIATLNGQPITLSDAQERVAFQVFRLRGDIYYLLKRETEQIVNQKLLDAEAARRGLTVDELLRKEVDDKVPPLEEKDVDNYLARQPKNTGKDPQKRNRIRTYLSQRARNQRKLDFFASLREKADFKFLLDLPRPPRTKIDIKGEPWRGNPAAPVTIIHFASFTNRLCADSTRMIKKVMDEYPNQIKWIHRNYFRINDEKALTAAQMGETAYEQGRFWDFHDLIFAFEGQFEMDDIEQAARDAGHKWNNHEAGEKESRLLLKVKADLRAAKRAGVTSVPVIFVNGLYFSPTFPYERLKSMVDKELSLVADSSNSGKQ